MVDDYELVFHSALVEEFYTHVSLNFHFVKITLWKVKYRVTKLRNHFVPLRPNLKIKSHYYTVMHMSKIEHPFETANGVHIIAQT
jgi:hypothetical protein